MRFVTLWCVLLVGVAGGAAGELGPPERSYNILMLLPVSSKSHRNVFVPLAEVLAHRGHQVTMLTNHRKIEKHHPNIHEFTHGLPDYQHENISMFDFLKDPTGGLSKHVKIAPIIARELYKVSAVKDLYEKRKEFDLIIVDQLFNEVAYPFVHEMPFIMVTTPGYDYRQSAVLGNVLHPGYVPNHMTDYPNPYSFWHRVRNTLTHIGIAIFWRTWAVVPLVQEEISAQFPDLPPLLDLERNLSLALMNTHFSTGIPMPLLPSQVEVGGMHCRPPSPLPQELESWITEAGAEGVIYFNLGSVMQGTTMPVKYRDLFIEAFRRLPQRVLWKHEGELEDLPDNVMTSKWLPQQDILAHHNVKVFITHGGLLSLQEAIYHATPLLALPVFADQPRNAMLLKKFEVGDFLTWEELSVDIIVNTLTDIINCPKYKENVVRMSAGMRDQLMSPRERAVFWTEYVIRHRGAPQLRSPAARLSWVEFFMLDVLLLLHLALFLLIFILRRILKVMTTKAFGNNNSKKKE
ncbi:UDP-glycosyltransferase UGT5 isoform X2 [Procambarus clarkii]|nr:UDP-glycosyltransferase UGT5-like isoform X2 [Procambarus clarkii]